MEGILAEAENMLHGYVRAYADVNFQPLSCHCVVAGVSSDSEVEGVWALIHTFPTFNIRFVAMSARIISLVRSVSPASAIL
jgi:hypothetical protein